MLTIRGSGHVGCSSDEHVCGEQFEISDSWAGDCDPAGPSRTQPEPFGRVRPQASESFRGSSPIASRVLP